MPVDLRLLPSGEEPEEPSTAVSRVVEPDTIPSRMEAAFLAFLQSRTPSTAVHIDRRLFLNLAEAAQFSGLPLSLVRRLIAAGKIKSLKTGAGWRISRAELERVCATLTELPKELTEHEVRDLEENSRRRRSGV